MATTLEIRAYLGRLTTILANYGANVPVPTLDMYPTDEVGFEFEAVLPGADDPKPALIRMVEVWEPALGEQFRLVEYAYDFVEYPLDRRRAFHRHNEDHFLREFGVAVHEHCEDQLGKPVCDHYYGLPVTGYDAIQSFAVSWGQPGSFGCTQLRCLG